MSRAAVDLTAPGMMGDRDTRRVENPCETPHLVGLKGMCRKPGIKPPSNWLRPRSCGRLGNLAAPRSSYLLTLDRRVVADVYIQKALESQRPWMAWSRHPACQRSEAPPERKECVEWWLRRIPCVLQELEEVGAEVVDRVPRALCRVGLPRARKSGAVAWR